MIRKKYYKKENRVEWLKLRNEFSSKGMVGGSDVATILHANPWRSAVELFYTCVGFTNKSVMQNQKMAWGTELEDKIADMYQYYDFETQDIVENYEMGLKVNPVRRVNAIITNTKYPYLFANIDRLLPDIDGIAEIKNTSGFVVDSYDKPNTHLLFASCPVGIPISYYAQLQQYLMCYEKDRGRFIFLRDGSKLIVHDIEKDEYLQEKIQEASIDFGTKVEKGLEIMAKYPDEERRIQFLSAIEPSITDQDTYNQFRTEQIADRQLRESEMKMDGTDEQLEIAKEYMRQSEILKEAKTAQTLASNQLKTEIFKNGIEIIDFGVDGKVSMKKRLSVKLT